MNTKRTEVTAIHTGDLTTKVRINMTQKHKKDNCTPGYVTFGGHCLNCGINAPPKPKPTKAERIARLRAFGFKIPVQK